jgi:probable addiction module antidote protein
MPIKTTPFDAAEYITTPEGCRDLLSEALESGDALYITKALSVIVRSRGIAQVAREAGLSREGLYKAISTDGDPKLSTLLGLTKALGITLTAQAKKAA